MAERGRAPDLSHRGERRAHPTGDALIEPFVYQAAPCRVIFGPGTIRQLPAELRRLGSRRALVLGTPARESQARDVAALLGPDAAGVFAKARMHTPTAITDEAMAIVERDHVDGLVAIGGGSTTGLAKAIALRTDLPQVIVPTTYAGSEMTAILGETQDGIKRTQSSERIRPETVIYDVELTFALSTTASAMSGMNAIAHAVEALYARDGNPITSAMALDAIVALSRALPRIIVAPADLSGRTEALYGAWLAGICLGSVGMALHHKLCHTLGGMFDLPHAETHAILLPYVLAYNAPAVPDAMASLAATLGHADPAAALYELAKSLGAPRGLGELGMPVEGIDTAAEQALANPYWNPRPLEYDAIRRLIGAAWAGEPPTGSGHS